MGIYTKSIYTSEEKYAIIELQARNHFKRFSRKERVSPMQSETEQFHIPHSAAGRNGTGMGSRCL